MSPIIFQNENFVICDKPAQVLSVPSRDREDPRRCLGIELQKELSQNIFPVHRLDFEVSGLIIFALNSKAHKVSQNWFESKLIRKKYLARTRIQDFSHWPPAIPTDRAVIEIQLGKEFYWRTQIQRGKKRSFESVHGEWAETQAVIFEIQNNEVSWYLYPLTGKPHQLRLELSRRGFPILGDKLYGGQKNGHSDNISLRSISLNLEQIQNRLGLPPIIEI